MRSVAVVVDSTEFYNDFALQRRAWADLFGLSDGGHLQVFVPRVVVRETARHYQREARRLDREVIAALADAMKQLRRVASVPDLNIRNIREELRSRREAFETRLEADLRKRGAHIIETPAMDTEILLDWAISDRKPFKANGAGFRDALVWG